MRAKWMIKCGAAATGLVALMAGCEDPGLGPDSAQPAPGYEANALLGGVLGASSDTIVTTFTVSPSGSGTYSLGRGHSIRFPAHSICDPATSSYGPAEWDAPCAVATTPIAITALSWIQPNGRSRIDFSPRLRFVPTKTVTLNMLDLEAVLDPSSRILWCEDGRPCIDESQNDPLLTTAINSLTGILSRRVKHFSGYNLSAGRTRNTY
jgi:hypothetical protein